MPPPSLDFFPAPELPDLGKRKRAFCSLSLLLFFQSFRRDFPNKILSAGREKKKDRIWDFHSSWGLFSFFLGHSAGERSRFHGIWSDRTILSQERRGVRKEKGKRVNIGFYLIADLERGLFPGFLIGKNAPDLIKMLTRNRKKKKKGKYLLSYNSNGER